MEDSLAPLAALNTRRDGGVVHATSVHVGGRGLLIIGPSGAGKSSLALQMIALGATLVGDDGTRVTPKGGGIELASPPNISGMIEARGLGLMQIPYAERSDLFAVLNLRADVSMTPRLPPKREIELFEIPIPLLTAALTPSLASALVLALKHNSLPTDAPQ